MAILLAFVCKCLFYWHLYADGQLIEEITLLYCKWKYKFQSAYEVENKFSSVVSLSAQYPKYPVLNERKRFYVLFKISKMTVQGISLLHWANELILTDMT